MFALVLLVPNVTKKWAVVVRMEEGRLPGKEGCLRAQPNELHSYNIIKAMVIWRQWGRKVYAVQI